MATAAAPRGAAAPGAATRTAVVWFRNDLRLRDNEALAAAAARVAAGEAGAVVPVYVFDPRAFAASPWGLPKTGAFRAQFLLESVATLQASLRALGSDLVVAVGKPEDVIPGLLGDGGEGCVVLTQEEVTSEELRVDAKVARAIKPRGGRLLKVWGSSLYHRDDLPFGAGCRDVPDVFTPFKDKAERMGKVRKEFPAPAAGAMPLPPGGAPAAAGAAAAGGLPSWEELPYPEGKRPARPARHAGAALDFRGGEEAALARLKYYLWDSDLVADYFNIRNGMLDGDYSTKLAPWLAAGCISPRTVYHEIKRYEAQRGANKSTYWVIFELTWRDFFKFFALKHGNAIFFEGGTSGAALPWSRDPELFERWAAGRTGMPLVDANMRELAATGWMSNRGRQNVASYLALDLGVDWRRGADWFEHHLLDYDAASNWGNWVSAAGLTGGRVNHFNVTKQAKDYDPQGDYIRHWLPELKDAPPSRVHEPWLMSKDEQARSGVQIGGTYPNPIPASRFGRPHGGGGGRGGGGRGGGGGGRRGGGGGGGRGGGREYKRSAFERFG
ncbi:MAG: cryptochrome DASH1 [Monoraphidium minutum]|nr:MAG: cryptochrome DASH1 [Monoraphidium minutum]